MLLFTVGAGKKPGVYGCGCKGLQRLRRFLNENYLRQILKK